MTADYVDLGLPSGTLWCSVNEDCGLLSYEDAVLIYKNKPPTKKQITELKDECDWKKVENGYQVTGPNGKSIILTLDGYHNCSGETKGQGLVGSYWSSTPDNKGNAWRLGFEEGRFEVLPKVSVTNHLRCYGRSVRLVK